MATVAVLFQHDLRTHDHPALQAAVERARSLNLPVIALYRLDPRLSQSHPVGGWPKQGTKQSGFRAQALISLKANLSRLGIPFVVVCAESAKAIVETCHRFHVERVYMTTEFTSYEVQFQSELKSLLESNRSSLELCEGKSLLNWKDVENKTGLQLDELPDVFTAFKRKVESVPIPLPLEVPTSLRADQSPQDSEQRIRTQVLLQTPATEADFAESDSAWKSLETLARSFESDVADSSVLSDAEKELWNGSEQSALAHLDRYVWKAEAVGHYKETRNALMGSDQSSRLSHWLAVGAISPRQVAFEVKRFESDRARGNQFESTQWLIYELLWRDYFIFLAGKIGSALFKGRPVHNRKHTVDVGKSEPKPFTEEASETERLQLWINGETGAPLIDACMRELKETGYTTNRGRQNVASFWAKTWKQDWRLGASYFESQLIDYDAAVNWGNWAYVAGQGNDPRNRVFDFERQSRMYDPSGDFIRKWVPELAHLDSDQIHYVSQKNS